MDRLTREEIEAAHDALCAAVALNLDMSKHWCEQKWKQAHMLRDLALSALSQEAVRDEAYARGLRYALDVVLDTDEQSECGDELTMIADAIREELALKREPNAADEK